MANLSFFSVMRNVSKSVSKGTCDKGGAQLFEALRGFVEDGFFSNSDITKFICKNWSKTPLEITSLWSVQTGVEKALSTFQAQVSVTSKQLFSLFPMFNVSMFESENCTDANVLKNRNEMYLVIDSFSSDNILANGIFISEVCSYYDGKASKEYDISDCVSEIELLRPLMKSNVFSYLDGIDTDKLAYIISLLNQPISSNRNRSVNMNKLHLMQQLNLIESHIQPTTKDVDVVTKEVYIEVPEEQPYKFGITKEMADIITKASESYTNEDVSKHTNLGIEGRKLEARKVAESLRVLSPKGLAQVLSRFNGLVITDAIKGNYEFSVDGIQPDGLTAKQKSFLK